MFYLFTALYAEAEPLLERFCLKKDADSIRFQQFSNEANTIRLTVTGPGGVPAAAAAASVLTVFPPAPNDRMVQIGICAWRRPAASGTPPLGAVYCCNKIIEQSTGRTFYPDMLFRHPFPEAAVLTGNLVLRNSRADPPEAAETAATAAAGTAAGAGAGAEAADWPDAPLYDMEAAAFYQSAAFFAGPHQIAVLKVVSDTGTDGRLGQSDPTRYLGETQAEWGPVLDRMARISNMEPDGGRQPGEEAKLLNTLSADLHCSRTMQAELGQILHWLRLEGVPVRDLLAPFYERGDLPCKTRQEGKIRFEQLKQYLL